MTAPALLTPRRIDRLRYHDHGPIGDAFCDVDIYPSVSGTLDIVIVTEREDNPGMSITNAAEAVHAAVAAHVRPGFVMIEHYPARRYGGTLPETFALVTVLAGRSAKWYGATRDEVEALIGGTLA